MVRVVSVRVTSRENATLPGIIMEVETHRFAKENGFRGHAIHGTGAFSVVGGPINDERR